MRQQIAYRQYNPNKPHRYRLPFESLDDARFPYTFKAVPYAATPKTGDGPYYLKSTIDYIKYLVTEMKADQPIRPYPSIESTNWLLEHGFRHYRKGEVECHLNFLKTKAERILVQLVILKSRRRTFS